MRITLQVSDLVPAVGAARRAVDNRAFVPVLRGLRLEAGANGVLRVTGTDMSETVTAAVPCETAEAGAAVVASARDFVETVKGYGPGIVTLSASGESVQLEHESGASSSVPALSLEDWPAAPELGESSARFVLSLRDWRRLFRSVFRFASSDETRPVLTAVRFELAPEATVYAVATDSYRLGFDYADALEASGETGASGLVPARALRAIGKAPRGIDSVVLSIGLDYARLEAGNVSVLSRLISGQYPDWRRLLPDSFSGSVTFEAESAAAAAVRFAKTDAGKSTPMRLELSPAPAFNLTTADAEGAVSSSAPVSVIRAEIAETVTIGCNARFLADALEAVGSDSVTADYINPLRPILFRNGRAGAGVLQMPIRLAG